MKEVIKMNLSNLKVGVAITGSFCTFDKIFGELQNLIDAGANVTTIFSFNAMSIDTRFGKADDFLERAYQITRNTPITTISSAEPIGPKKLFDILIIAPCTGNSLAKLANGITDTPVLMATKSHLRNGRPVVISISSNDSLSTNLKNIGLLANSKNMFFVPFGQDNHKGKPYSMISHSNLIIPTLESALDGKQLQPIILSPHDN